MGSSSTLKIGVTGTAANPAVIRGADGEDVIISEPNTTVAYLVEFLSGSRYLIIENINFKLNPTANLGDGSKKITLNDLHRI